jgi:hypothetical protein
VRGVHLTVLTPSISKVSGEVSGAGSADGVDGGGLLSR